MTVDELLQISEDIKTNESINLEQQNEEDMNGKMLTEIFGQAEAMIPNKIIRARFVCSYADP